MLSEFAQKLAIRIAKIEGSLRANESRWTAVLGTQRPDANRLKQRALLHNAMCKHLDDGDIRTLCFGLGVDYEDLGGDGKNDRARELLLTIIRERRLDSLMVQLVQLRPQIKWPDGVE